MAIHAASLPYKLSALEPYISEKTLSFHHEKHHKGYAQKLNDLINNSDYEGLSLLQIIKKSFEVDELIYNNAAQLWNHDFYFHCMTPSLQQPSEKFLKLIVNSFESYEQFKDQFIETGKNQFGSGWVWVLQRNKKLHIQSTSNAKNIFHKNESPILVCDVWEHSYYLDYQHEREKYLKNFWSLINWGIVEENLKRLETKDLLEHHFGS